MIHLEFLAFQSGLDLKVDSIDLWSFASSRKGPP
jgi:hypothetical protein